MSKMSDGGPCWQRRNYKWTPGEIEALVDYGILQFLPETWATKQPRLGPDRQQKLKSGLATKLDDDVCRQLDVLVDQLRKLRVTDEELETKIIGSIARLFPTHSTVYFAGAEDGEPQAAPPAEAGVQRPIDIAWLATVIEYVRVSLGLYPKAQLLRSRTAQSRDRRQWRRDRLARTSQSSCVQEWTGLYDDIWTDPTWRECMWMRYEKSSAPAIKLLPRAWRDRLNREAQRLRIDPGADRVTPDQLQAAADGQDPRTWIGFAHGVLRFDYLWAQVAGEWNSKHPLTKPVHASGLFPRVAMLRARDQHDPGARANYVERFCRYLTIPPGHPNELTGRLLVRLMHIESDFWQQDVGDASKGNGSDWPPKQRLEELVPSRDFRTVADRITAALAIDARVTSDIWGVWCGLKLGHFWQKRAAVKYTAYWLARLLETEHNDVFRIYSKWIECFALQILRPLLRHKGAGRPGINKAAVGPFFEAMLEDPLLCAALHYEVLRGKSDVEPPRWTRKREDNVPLNLIVAHACEKLSQAHPETPKVSIETILPDSDLKDRCTQVAARKTDRDLAVGGYTLYAYVAPLVTAMINDEKTIVTRDQVKDIHRRHKNDPVLAELASGPDRFVARMTRGETLR
jgi:hypothetical protein